MTTVTQPATSPAHRALVSPQIDFWLVGGASFVFLGLAWLSSQAFGNDWVYHAGWWAFYATFVVNLPHFAYSYMLFYKGYGQRLKEPDFEKLSKIRLFVAGVLAPVILINYFHWCYITRDPMLMAYAISAMFFFVGWHYVKQGYGALITLSVYKSIFYTLWEKRILYINAYAVWIYAWLKVNSVVAEHLYYDIHYTTMGFPEWPLQVALIAVCITSLLALSVLTKVWILDKKGFALSGVTGYASATYMWILIPDIHEAYFYFVPFFHSLQYLPFVYKYKKSEWNSKKSNDHSDKKPILLFHPLVLFTLTGVVLGAIFMELGPALIDKLHVNWDALFYTQNFFLVAFVVFINIHHYFIDNAFWRRDNKAVQNYLFRS